MTNKNEGSNIKRNVVIIGGNFAGISAARKLSALNTGNLNISLIEPADNFNWTPNVHEILSGVKNAEGVEISRGSLLAGLGVTLVKDRVVKIDKKENVIHLHSNQTMDFDACLIACGYQSNLPLDINSTMAEQHFQFRNADDVENLADAIKQHCSIHDSLSITIVGGGFTGVEALGELLRARGKNCGKSRSSATEITKADINITLVESSGNLVKGLSNYISDDILRLTKDMNIQFQFNSRVTGIKEGELLLSNGSSVKTDITVWTNGGSIPHFVLDSELAKSEETGIRVNGYLQSELNADCFVAGDIANLLLDNGTALAKQSYFATDMGQTSAVNLFNWLRNKPMEEFIPKAKPVLLSFGDINTYLISGQTVVASPLLAATKEALYQVSMFKLTSPIPKQKRKSGLIQRLTRSTSHLLLPELQPATLLKVLSRSRFLGYGGQQDLLPLLQGVRSTLFDPL